MTKRAAFFSSFRGAAAIMAIAVAAHACGKSSEAPAAEKEVDAAQSKSWFIAAANPYAARAGADILKRGGSAVDAAIATQAVLGLVEPQSSGLGGGAFMMHFDPATGALETYDGRETAPASATPERFLKEDGEPMNYYDAVAGGLSVGVPGVVRMLGLAHAEHGVLPWADTLISARDLANEGFDVSPRLNGLLAQFSRLEEMPAAAAYFYDAEGAPHPVGYKLNNPAYAATLDILINEGADGFYRGPIAEAIVEAVNAAPNPGGMTLEDIAGYQPVKRPPVCGGYRGKQICSMGPPSSGGVTLLQILALVEEFDIAAAPVGAPQTLHLLLEASRLAYADRATYLADQDQSSEAGGLPVETLVAGLMNPVYLDARAALIDAEAAAPDVMSGDPSEYPLPDGEMPGAWKNLAPDASAEPPSTSHFVIVDGEGRVVSMTTTVEFAFGSHQMAAGMILNNQLTDFSFLPVRDGVPVANAVAPGKRPRSSMSPVIVFDEDGDIWGAFGSPGGPAIIGYVAKTLIGVIDWGLGLQAAVNYPNIVIPRGGALLETDGYSPEVIADLEARGHDIMVRDLTSGVHGFVVSPVGYVGAADPRREGVWLTGAVAD